MTNPSPLMPDRPNRLSRFWQELKRRKVIQVIVVYTSAAFVLIELVNNTYETLNLPERTPALTLIILVIGFPLAIILSWIYDISLKGITKTEKAIPSGRTSSTENSIAVLPFQDMSREKDQEYFCDGIAEEIINALAHVSSLKVIARTSAFAFKNQQLDMREIGRKLNVEALLEGSIRKDSNRLRITAQLIKTDDGSHIWSERFDREQDDIFAIQDEISIAIVENLKVELLGNERSAILKRYTEDFEVYNLYLKASHNVQRATPLGFEKAIEYFGEILRKDPHFVPAYAGLAAINVMGSFLGNIPPNIGYPKAKEYAELVLEIDASCPDVHHKLGLVSMYYDWDWISAERHLKKALQLNPNNEWFHNSYSFFLIFMDRFDEAISEAERAVELDPVSGYFNAELGFIYYCCQQYEQSINQLMKTVNMFPNFYMGYLHLGIAYRCLIKMNDAIEAFKTAVRLSGEIPMVVAFLANVLYEINNKEEAERLINSLIKRSETEYVPALCFVPYYLLKVDHDQAYKCLERAIQEHDSYLPLSVALPIKEYRIPNEPRYAELMKKVGLQRYFQNK